MPNMGRKPDENLLFNALNELSDPSENKEETKEDKLRRKQFPNINDWGDGEITDSYEPEVLAGSVEPSGALGKVLSRIGKAGKRLYDSARASSVAKKATEAAKNKKFIDAVNQAAKETTDEIPEFVKTKNLNKDLIREIDTAIETDLNVIGKRLGGLSKKQELKVKEKLWEKAMKNDEIKALEAAQKRADEAALRKAWTAPSNKPLSSNISKMPEDFSGRPK